MRARQHTCSPKRCAVRVCYINVPCDCHPTGQQMQRLTSCRTGSPQQASHAGCGGGAVGGRWWGGRRGALWRGPGGALPQPGLLPAWPPSSSSSHTACKQPVRIASVNGPSSHDHAADAALRASSLWQRLCSSAALTAASLAFLSSSTADSHQPCFMLAPWQCKTQPGSMGALPQP